MLELKKRENKTGKLHLEGVCVEVLVAFCRNINILLKINLQCYTEVYNLLLKQPATLLLFSKMTDNRWGKNQKNPVASVFVYFH